VITLDLNGAPRRIASAPETPLLYVLRDECGLNGAKFGCGLGQCGACTVVVDGRAVLSCVTPVGALEGRAVTTVEGLGTPEAPGPLQQAFIDENAAQCGYCIAGMVMRAHALLAENPQPTEAEAREALRLNLCRCGTHRRILAAILRAARRQAADLGTGGVR
jgi:nicotinate dehydrogenase subunit A